MSFYLSTLVVYFFIDLLLAYALNMQFGWGGIPNFALIMFQAVGAALLLGLVTEEVAALGGAPYATVAGFAILAIVLATRPAALAGQATDKAEITV